ncbi:MAG: hypothetical protein JSV25_05850 [Spirochaetota bacterium]|nr:MAG: hypothetical protein JSV25_05850 [Spirochaetota bacterium]
MKKVILLIMSALLVVAFAVPAMADVSFSGRILDSFITGFAPKEGKATFNYYYLYLDMVAEVDEYNTVTMEFTGFPGMAHPMSWAYGGWALTAANLETDVGAAMGFPVGLTATIGNFWACTRKWEASWSAVERYGGWGGGGIDRQCYQINGVQAKVDFGVGNVAVGTSIGENWGLAGETAPVQYIILGLPELGPVDVEAYIYGVGDTEFKPVIGGNVKVAIDPVDAAAGFDFDLDTSAWDYGVGARASFGMFGVGAALAGNDTDALDSINLEAGAEFAELGAGTVGADVGVGLGLFSGADTFQGAEISVYYAPGASTWRVGYIITQNAYAYMSVAAIQDGGLFVSGDIEF